MGSRDQVKDDAMRPQARNASLGRPRLTGITPREMALVVIVLCITTAVVGLGNDLMSQALSVSGSIGNNDADVEFISVFTDDDGIVDDPLKDPLDNGTDPGHGKDVAHCTAMLDVNGLARVTVAGSYPSYTCHFWVEIENVGEIAVRCTVPEIAGSAELSVLAEEDIACVVLRPGDVHQEGFSVHVEHQAQQGTRYTFEVTKLFSEAVAGTTDLWRGWDSNTGYTAEQITAWLREISDSSQWLTVYDLQAMDAVLAADSGKGSNAEKRFLAQYLAMRLNERAGILCPGDEHDVTSQDKKNYLQLTNPHQATLVELISAIETRWGTSPTNPQFLAIRDVCDALNNLEI